MTNVDVTDRVHPHTRGARIGAGLAFVAVAMVAASMLAGLGVASSTPSAAQYQYGKKIAICHHTASKTHPWVTLRIDIHAWPGFLKHGDTLGACAGKAPEQSQDGKIAICHYTPSKNPPWVTLRINRRAWPAHLQHGDQLGPCGDSLPPTPTTSHGNGKPKSGDGSNGDQGSGGGHGHNK